MLHHLADRRVPLVLGAGLLISGSAWIAQDTLPPPLYDGPWDARVAVAEAPDLSGGPLTAETLAALAAHGDVGDLGDLRPLAGAPLVPTVVGPVSADQPEGLSTLLAAAVAHPEPYDHALDRARQAIRDPGGEHPLDPAAEARLRTLVAEGLAAGLAELAPLLVDPDATHRPRLLLVGAGRDGAWHLPPDLAPYAEAATYGAWLDLLAEAYAERDIPALRWELGVDLAPSTQPPLAPLLTALAAGEDLDPSPLHALGRLQAAHLLARADLVTLVFAGHGQQVRDPAAKADRFGAYRLGRLAVGDRCEEPGILRDRRGGPSIRFGLCMPADGAHVSLSCAMVSDGKAGPQHGSAAVAWFAETGSWPAFQAIEPAAFRLFPVLQQGQLAAPDPAGLSTAARETVTAGRARLSADRTPGPLVEAAAGLWRLRVGGMAEPDLLVAGPDRGALSPQETGRVAASTATWEVLREEDPAGPVRARPAPTEYVDPCGTGDCAATLDALGPLPRRVPLGDHTVAVAAAPDRENPRVTLAVLPSPGESDAAWAARAWEIQRSLQADGAGRQVLGVHRVD